MPRWLPLDSKEVLSPQIAVFGESAIRELPPLPSAAQMRSLGETVVALSASKIQVAGDEITCGKIIHPITHRDDLSDELMPHGHRVGHTGTSFEV
jgi:hypothetical protein